MSRAILLSICGVLLGAACLIAYLGMHESYARLRDGTVYDGTVTEHRSDGVIYEYVDERGETQKRISRDAPQSLREELPVGAAVKVHASSTDTKLAQDVERPPFLLLLGALGSLAFAVWIVIRGRVLRRRFQEAAGDFEATLGLAIARARTQYVAMFVIGMVFAAGFVFVIVAAPDVGTGEAVFIGLLALASLGLAGVGGRRAWAVRDVTRSEIFRRLQQTPQRVTRVQGLRVTSGDVPGVSHHSFTVHFDDGYQFQISLGDIGVQEFVVALQQRAPQAEFAV